MCYTMILTSKWNCKNISSNKIFDFSYYCMCFNKGNAGSWNKKVSTSKNVIVCGRLILCVLIYILLNVFNKGNLSHPEIKRFQASKNFRLRRAHMMCFINKMSHHGIKGFNLKIFACGNLILYLNKLIMN